MEVSELYGVSLPYLVENAWEIKADHLITQEALRADIGQDYISDQPHPLLMIFHAIVEHDLYRDTEALGITSFEGGVHLHQFLNSGDLVELRAAEIAELNKEPEVPVVPDEGAEFATNPTTAGKLLSCYYLMRHYWLAGISKFLIIPHEEGFIVAVKDPESDTLWVPAFIDRLVADYVIPDVE